MQDGPPLAGARAAVTGLHGGALHPDGASLQLLLQPRQVVGARYLGHVGHLQGAWGGSRVQGEAGQGWGGLRRVGHLQGSEGR